ncbi:Thioredoxin reductase [Promicromonospora umidemergens]|uniref:NAD(P)/FAD-dependent oxidoreductase n=1 Tax=Promicromonospora umidemergens TaxID=629679 RepID=A0ABP8X8J3_9MICO|nr:NAD(P)/FAD-dependent oxidoreductase [Promicromonospora umidemergens]MCP2281394.1 Thioredoxin reductase [Promicromonospora umidemergens]
MSAPDPSTSPYDAVVIGGGPAGLQAALTLGRMHRRVLLLDSGEYRNAPAEHLHNFVTRDGTPPAEFRAVARAELAAYATVTVREAAATAVVPDGDGFRVELGAEPSAEGADGPESLATRTVLLATGLRDTLPAIPGLAPLFGTVAAVCPYCHGHELSGEHVAVLGNGPHVARVAFLLERIASRLTVLTDGAELEPGLRAQLDAAGVAVRPEPVKELNRSAAGATVSFAEGPSDEVGGIFVASEFAQRAPFAAQLGLRMQESGAVEVDPMGRTSVPGVFAAGDMAHTSATPMPLASVLWAAASGLMAAGSADGELLARDHPAPS